MLELSVGQPLQRTFGLGRAELNKGGQTLSLSCTFGLTVRFACDPLLPSCPSYFLKLLTPLACISPLVHAEAFLQGLP